MFNGIIQSIGTIHTLTHNQDDLHIGITTTLDLSQVHIGDSVAVNGVCLSITHQDTQQDEQMLSMDISSATLACTTFANLAINQQVNLELAMQLSDRLNGHLLSGHIDDIGKVTQQQTQGGSLVLTIAAPPPLMKFICYKGAISVDGVSLTINQVSAEQFTVNIIPHTLKETIVSTYTINTQVNLEVDLIARYLYNLSQY